MSNLQKIWSRNNREKLVPALPPYEEEAGLKSFSITVTGVRKYLKTLGPDDVAGIPNDICHCPIANFVLDHYEAQNQTVLVAALLDFTYVWNPDTEKCIALHPHSKSVQRFILDVDLSNALPVLMPVSVDKSLMMVPVLRSAKALLLLDTSKENRSLKE